MQRPRHWIVLLVVIFSLSTAGCEDTTTPILVPNTPPAISLLLPVPTADGEPVQTEADGAYDGSKDERPAPPQVQVASVKQ